MWDHVLELITQYGYWALFFSMVLGIAGLPIPDETLLVFSGYLITQGKMDPRGAMMAAAAGAVGGISLSYTLGRTLGYSALTRYGRWVRITPARLDQIHKWFESYGGWPLVFGYYIAGVRHFTAFVAGSAGMDYPRFARYAYPAGLAWAGLFLGLGYVLGENWKRALEMADRLVIPAALVGIAVLAIVWWRSRRKI